MSISSLIVPSIDIVWAHGVALSPSKKRAFYVDEWNLWSEEALGRKKDAGGRESTTLDLPDKRLRYIPFSRIMSASPDGVDYRTLSTGILFTDDLKAEKARLERLQKIFAKDVLSKVGGTLTLLDRRSSLVGISRSPIKGTKGALLRLGVLPLIPVGGLASVYGVSLSLLENMFCSSVSYHVSRKGTVYYHANVIDGEFGKIVFKPEFTEVSDNPTANILTAFRETVGAFEKKPSEILLFEPPAETRSRGAEADYGAKAFKALPKGFVEAFGRVLSDGYLITIEATEEAMIDVIPWVGGSK